MKNVICMGSINMDIVMYMQHLPHPGETVVTDNFATFPGGKGGNQSATCASLGAHVSYLTRLGDDHFSKILIQEQQKHGVETGFILHQKEGTAGIAMIQVDENGQNCISFTPGSNSLLSPKDIQQSEKLFELSDILLITMEISTETVYSAIRMANKHGLTVVLDPSPVPSDGIPAEIACMVDYTKPNETEAEALTGIEVTDFTSAQKALDKLVSIGFKKPIVTLSSKGAIAKTDEGIKIIDPVEVDTIDSTAAGDVFLGSFTAALASGKSDSYCLDFANTAAALSTTRKGAQSSIPTIAEIEHHMK